MPKTVAALRALLLAAQAERDGALAERDSVMAERDQLAAERDALASQNDRLRHLLLRLKRMQFGAKSERLPEEQLQLGLEDLEQAIAQGEAEGEKRDPALKRERAARRRASRGALPAHLARVGVTLKNGRESTFGGTDRERGQAASTGRDEATAPRRDLNPSGPKVPSAPQT